MHKQHQELAHIVGELEMLNFLSIDGKIDNINIYKYIIYNINKI